MKNFIKMRSDLSNAENIVFLAAISVYMPYQITAAVILVLSVYIIFKTKIKETVFCHLGALLVPIFSVITAITGIVQKNYLGAGASVLFFLMMVIGFYIRTVMTTEIFEKALDLCCITSIFSSTLIILERIIYISAESHRCFGDFFSNMYLSMFFHPNYLGSIMAATIIVCGYKVIVKKTDKKYYYSIAILAAAAMFLTESMFAWIEVLAGLSILLLLARRHQLLGILLILAAFGCTVLYFVPELFPRLSQIGGSFGGRVRIWDLALDKIPDSFLFGHGFFGYYNISQNTPNSFVTTHAHNIFFEPLLSFGLVGSAILFACIFIYFHKVVLCKNLLRKSGITSLIMALITGVLIHSIIDMTMLWIQPAMLYCVIFGGLGADEKTLHRIFKTKP